MRPFVYVAGPITKPEPMENVHQAIVIATELLDSGLVAPFVPHTTALWHMITPRPYEAWLDYDLDVIERCDALLRLPGESAGADIEHQRANTLAIPVFHEIGRLMTWAEKWVATAAFLGRRPEPVR